MQMSGTRQIAAAQAEVWRNLNDPEVLKRCIPGCESLEKTDDANMKGVVAIKLGPMALRFNGDVQLSNINAPNSYRLSGKGKAGPAGFASGFADVKLEPKDGGTLLTYNVESTVGGRMAQLGARLIDATAAQLAGQFFDKFAAEVAPAAAATAGAAVAASAASGSGATAAGRWLPIWAWAIIGLIVLAALYFLVTII
jgi:uncharacterized protein